MEQDRTKEEKDAGRAAAFRISGKRTLLELAVLLASGAAMSLAFIPVDVPFFAWVSVIPLIWLCMGRTKKRAFFYGLIWGYAWHLPGTWFLREIMFFIPFGFAAVLALFNAVFAMCIPPLLNNLIYPDEIRKADFDERADFYQYPVSGEILATLTLAAVWVLLEWLRSWIFTGFPWNLLGVSQWQNFSLIQICEYTGIYGLSFLIILMNVAACFAIHGFRFSLPEGKYKRPFPLIFTIILIIVANSLGITICKQAEKRIRSGSSEFLSAGVVQPHLSQRREGTKNQSEEALDTCYRLTSNLISQERENASARKYMNSALAAGGDASGIQSGNDLEMKKDLYPLQLIVWPESAVPRVYYNYPQYESVLNDLRRKVVQNPALMSQLEAVQQNMPFEAYYRRSVRKLLEEYPSAPIILGTITFSPDGKENFNSALMLRHAKPDQKKYDYDTADVYSKVHIVPFGEFVPLAKIFPALDGIFGMGRSLSPGKSFRPVNVPPDFRLGVLICYEDVFAYTAREHARAGANVLLVITNDAWYPVSSEPRQHYVNSIFRTVETRLPMIRVGNSDYSVFIDPFGRLCDSVFKTFDRDGNRLFHPERKSSGSAKFLVPVEQEPQMTFYTMYGDVFVLFCVILAVCGFGFAAVRAWNFYRDRNDPLAEKRRQLREDFLKSGAKGTK